MDRQRRFKSLTTGNYNVAIGADALLNLAGASSNNIVIGTSSGTAIVTGQDNICINHIGRNLESGNIVIGNSVQNSACYIAGIRGITTGNDATYVFIDSNGKLGTNFSSRRYKEDIADMGDASARLLLLRPVTFRYKKPSDNGQKPVQFGLIAEEVAEAFPELAILNNEGRPRDGEIPGSRPTAAQ